MTAPTLAPPGAGLPFFEQWLLRHITFPIASWRLPPARALAHFKQEQARLLALVKTIATPEKPVLIKRLAGLEDSSRYWSAAMVLEHLAIVNNGITQIIQTLLADKPPTVVVRTADVKPTGLPLAMAQDAFQTTAIAALRLQDVTNWQATSRRHQHPWLGALSARGWLSLMALHMSIHYRQLEAIAAQCPRHA